MSVTLGSNTVNINGRSVHSDGTNSGFLRTDGNWDFYLNNSGQLYSSNYGWLHDYFFYTTSNCVTAQYAGGAINCYGSGNIVSWRQLELVDNGGNVYNRTVQILTNCNCNCDCL